MTILIIVTSSNLDLILVVVLYKFHIETPPQRGTRNEFVPGSFLSEVSMWRGVCEMVGMQAIKLKDGRDETCETSLDSMLMAKPKSFSLIRYSSRPSLLIVFRIEGNPRLVRQSIWLLTERKEKVITIVLYINDVLQKIFYKLLKYSLIVYTCKRI